MLGSDFGICCLFIGLVGCCVRRDCEGYVHGVVFGMALGV